MGNKQINLKVFMVFSLLLTGLCLFFAKGYKEVLVILFTYLATLVNLYMTSRVVMQVVIAADDKQKMDKQKMFFMTIGKLLVLFGALSIGVLFMGNRIIIPVLNYVAQIFALGVSYLKPFRKS